MIDRCISFDKTNYYNSLITDYLKQKEQVRDLYNHFPSVENVLPQINEKQELYANAHRSILVDVLNEQYKNVITTDVVKQNIESLKNTHTFTITTGHQLNLFTGPLYFIYKIISVVNTCNFLKKAYPEFDFVPIYWMATEDHDFEEINYFNLKNSKIEWNRNVNGAVGRLNLQEMELVFQNFEKVIGKGNHAKELLDLFKKAYLLENNLANATRVLVNELFKEYGLVILDADNKKLKELFIPYFKKELEEQVSYKNISLTNAKLLNYNPQVNPREINLFYLTTTGRERIVLENGKYKVLNTDVVFEQKDLLDHLNSNPEKFSPNVVLRPLYQEVLLPNLMYIGGGGEISYWLQLKTTFANYGVSFPMLQLRSSLLLLDEIMIKKIEKHKLTTTNLFEKVDKVIDSKLAEWSEVEINFDETKRYLKQQFDRLKEKSNSTHISFLNAILAQEKKQLKGIEHLDKKLKRALKIQNQDKINSLKNLYIYINGGTGVQERTINFSQFYTFNFISVLSEYIVPFSSEIQIILL